MAEIIELPDNLITPDDKEIIESFAAHELSHGRATRFTWDRNDNDDPVFKLYRGGADEELAVTITHSRKEHEFQVHNKAGKQIISGTLDEIMIDLDKKLMREHDEKETPA